MTLRRTARRNVEFKGTSGAFWRRAQQAYRGLQSCCELVTGAKQLRLHEGDRMWGGTWSVNREPMNKNRIEGRLPPSRVSGPCLPRSLL